jgi:hypothetical protein
MAWTNLDPLGALRLNPLFFLLCLATIAWALHSLTFPFIGWRWPERVRRWAASFGITWVLVALIFLNWVYLCLTLPQ